MTSGVTTLSFNSGCLPLWSTSHVPRRPTVEASVLDVGNVIRNQIVAQGIALIYGTPQVASDGIHCQADAVRDAVRVNPHSRAIRINSRTSARFFSAGVASGSSIFEAEPTESHIFLPSGENKF